MKSYFTNDLEWYQDNGGLIGYEKVFINFQSIFNRDYDLKRNLIKGKLNNISLGRVEHSYKMRFPKK